MRIEPSQSSFLSVPQFCPAVFERGVEKDTLSSGSASNDSGWNPWNLVKIVWEGVYEVASGILSLCFCRPFCRPERPVDYDQFFNDLNILRNAATTDEQGDIFESLPLKFQNQVLRHFNSISSGDTKIATFEDVALHDHFYAGFDELAKRFYCFGLLSEISKLTKKISKNPKENLTLFDGMSSGLKRRFAEKLVVEGGLTIPQKIQAFQEKPRAHLTTAKFTTAIEEVRQNTQTLKEEAEEILRAQKEDN